MKLNELPTFPIVPLDAELEAEAIKARCQERARHLQRVARLKALVLARMANIGRELTQGEIRHYVLTACSPEVKTEVLDELVAERKLARREEYSAHAPGNVSYIYRLLPLKGRA